MEYVWKIIIDFSNNNFMTMLEEELDCKRFGGKFDYKVGKSRKYRLHFNRNLARKKKKRTGV